MTMAVQVDGAALEARVIETLLAHPAVTTARLAGSRARGTANAFSDWDFAVESSDFLALARDLPRVVEALEPLSAMWDPYADFYCFMMLLRGPVRVDILFLEQKHEPGPPWQLTRQTLPAIDCHFWDWINWAGSKVAAGDSGHLEWHLPLLSRMLLQPIGAAAIPRTVEEAVRLYVAARSAAEKRFGLRVSRELEEEVCAGLRRHCFAV
jgi:predicted nucleotidyltransferase